MSMTTSYVYKLTNKVNDKIYIGKSNNPHQRLIKHFSIAKNRYNKNNQYQLIHKAINKYKKENFVFEIIEVCDSSKLALEREKYWIHLLNTNNKDYGYNLTDGGDGGCTVETAVKISKSLKGRINSPFAALDKFFKILSFIPEFKEKYKPITKHEFNRKIKVENIFRNFIKNNKYDYDLLDSNKQLTDNLKKDILKIYFDNTQVSYKDLSMFFNLTLKQINYIINRYRKGISTEEQKRINRSNGHKGKKHSKEHREKISQANIGRIISLESREKISKANSGDNNGMSGKTHSIDAKKKMSLFQSNRVRHPLTEMEKQQLSKNLKGKPRPPRIPIEIKNEVVQLYASGSFTKKQLAQKFGLKYNSIVKIIKSHNIAY